MTLISRAEQVTPPSCINLTGGAVLVLRDDSLSAYAGLEIFGQRHAAPIADDELEFDARVAEWTWMTTVERVERRRAFRAVCRAAPHLYELVLAAFLTTSL